MLIFAYFVVRHGDALRLSPEKLADVSLEESPMTVGSRLGRIGRGSTTAVNVTLAGGQWERAYLDSDDGWIDAMTLVPEATAKDAVPKAIEAFARRFHATNDFVWEWGNGEVRPR